jgi:signal transduction histidine kinase
VSDTGVGISPDNLPSITEPFSQGHSDPHVTQNGTGLGLSIVESLVDANDGELNIESEVGKGTIVSVTFPIQKPATD